MHQNYQYSITQINEKQQQKTTTTTNKQLVGSMKMHKEVGYDRMTGAS